MKYLVARGNETDHIEAESPIIAAQKFSNAKKMRKGSVLRVLDTNSKVRIYKVGINPRVVNPHDVLRLL